MSNKLACLIPCFNESKNLALLCQQININSTKNIDWYIINNGSTDLNKLSFKEIIKKNIKVKNYYIFNVKKNKGYGFGIKKCIAKISKNYELICWTHSDGQTPISDVMRSYEIFQKKSKIDLIKGIRISRKDGLIATSFTACLNTILRIFLNKKSLSPNSQPTLIKSEFSKLIYDYAQDDANYDISVMLLAKKFCLNIERFPVEFKKRVCGIGANESFIQKFDYSLKILKFLLRNFFIKKKY